MLGDCVKIVINVGGEIKEGGSVLIVYHVTQYLVTFVRSNIADSFVRKVTVTVVNQQFNIFVCLN